MKTKWLLFCFSFFITCFVYGRSVLKVYIGLRDCMNCYASLSSLRLLSNCEKQIIIFEKDSSTIAELLFNYNLPSDLKFVYVDSPPKQASYCLFYIDSYLRDSFDLKVLSNKIDFINTSDARLKKYYFPKAPKLSRERTEISSLRKKNIFVHDYILNKIIIYELIDRNDTLKKIVEIKGNQFSSRLMIKMAGLDSLLYSKIKNRLKSIGKSFAHIESSYITDTSLSVLLNFPSPYVNSSSRDTIIGMSFFIYQKNLITGENKLTFIDHESLIGPYSFRYAMDNTRGFFLADSALILPVNDFKHSDDKLKILSKWTNKNGKYSFSGFSNLLYDTKDFEKKEVTSIVHSVNEQYYFNTTLTLLIDLKKDQFVNQKCVKPLQVGFANDVMGLLNGMCVLFVQNDQAFLNNYDFSKDQMTSKKISVPENCEFTSIKFSDKNTLQFVDQDYSAIYFMNFQP